MPLLSPLYRLTPALLLLLAACGDDGGGDGGGDSLLTGFSGLVILILVIWLIVHLLRTHR